MDILFSRLLVSGWKCWLVLVRPFLQTDKHALLAAGSSTTLKRDGSKQNVDIVAGR